MTPGHRRWRPGGCGAPCRCRHRRSGRAESGRAPPCMRWRGPARPRRTGWSVVWPCRRRAPPAGARYPCERPVSRLLPRSRRRPQVVPVSSGRAFLMPTRAPRKSLRAAISGSSAIHEGNHRKRPVIRISRRLSTVLFTAYPQPRDREPENAGTAATGCNRRTVHIGWRVIIRGDLIRCGTDSLAVAEDPAVRPSRSPMNHSRRPRPRAPRQRQLPARHAGMADDRRRLGGTGRAVLADPEGQRVLRRARCDGRWPQAPCRRRRATSGVQSG